MMNGALHPSCCKTNMDSGAADEYEDENTLWKRPIYQTWDIITRDCKSKVLLESLVHTFLVN